MARPDLNLLFTLNVLLEEGSVTGAARRLNLSPSAMSRSSTRLREATGDPLLVRAGRGLVPTPRANELRAIIGQVVQDAEAVLRPVVALDPANLVQTFTIRTSEGFVEEFGADLVAAISKSAPGVTLSFLPKPDKDSKRLRDGGVDLETGVVSGDTGPEIRAQVLFRDRFIGVVAADHPFAAKSEVSLADYARAQHVVVRRAANQPGPVDKALMEHNFERRPVVGVGSYYAALALVTDARLVATVPEAHTKKIRDGLHGFRLPFAIPELTISMLWHPRLNADPAHRWLRQTFRHVCLSRLETHSCR